MVSTSIMVGIVRYNEEQFLGLSMRRFIIAGRYWRFNRGAVFGAKRLLGIGAGAGCAILDCWRGYSVIAQLFSSVASSWSRSRLAGQRFLPEGTQFRDWRSGRVITESVLGSAIAERYGAPYYHIHRGDLLDVLLGLRARIRILNYALMRVLRSLKLFVQALVCRCAALA